MMNTKMKKTLLVIAIILLVVPFILSVQGEETTPTASMLMVNEKGHTKDYDEYWIKAYNPNNLLRNDLSVKFRVFLILGDIKEKMS